MYQNHDTKPKRMTFRETVHHNFYERHEIDDTGRISMEKLAKGSWRINIIDPASSSIVSGLHGKFQILVTQNPKKFE